MQAFYPGDKEFTEILAKASIPMDVHTVKAFVAGFVLGPEYVPSDIAADEILLVGTDQEIKFPTPPDRESFISALNGLWNEVSEFRMPSVRKIRPLPEAFDNYEFLYAYLERLCEDAAFFMAALEESGLSLDDQSWSEERLESAMEELEAFLTQSERFLEALKRKRLRTKTDFSKLVRELCVFHDVWENSFVEICTVLKTMRNEGKSPLLNTGSLTPISSMKMGASHATCPCGSGKTYRECCMLKLVN